MTSEGKSLLVEGGASHTWIVVTDTRRVWAEEWLPSLNGASGQAQRSVLTQIATVAGRFAGIEDALYAVGGACTFLPVTVDVALMGRTSKALRSDQSIFQTIAQAIQATRLLPHAVGRAGGTG